MIFGRWKHYDAWNATENCLQVPQEAAEERHYFALWDVEGAADGLAVLGRGVAGEEGVAQRVERGEVLLRDRQPERLQLLRSGAERKTKRENEGLHNWANTLTRGSFHKAILATYGWS